MTIPYRQDLHPVLLPIKSWSRVDEYVPGGVGPIRRGPLPSSVRIVFRPTVGIRYCTVLYRHQKYLTCPVHVKTVRFPERPFVCFRLMLLDFQCNNRRSFKAICVRISSNHDGIVCRGADTKVRRRYFSKPEVLAGFKCTFRVSGSREIGIVFPVGVEVPLWVLNAFLLSATPSLLFDLLYPTQSQVLLFIAGRSMHALPPYCTSLHLP